jgi:hypothetical protein
MCSQTKSRTAWRLRVSESSTIVREPDNIAEAMPVCKCTHAHNVVQTLDVLCVVMLCRVAPPLPFPTPETAVGGGLRGQRQGERLLLAMLREQAKSVNSGTFCPAINNHSLPMHLDANKRKSDSAKRKSVCKA